MNEIQDQAMHAVDTRSATGLLALTALRGIGAVTAERIAHRFESLEEVSSAALSRLSEVTSHSIATSLQDRGVLSRAIDAALRILDRAQQLDVHIISVFDPKYPTALKRLHDRPPVIFVKGRLDSLERCVACIGTREPSEFGVQVTQRIVEKLVSANWCIVSGLALGIDSIAHKAALGNRGRTIAVMAGGLDNIYPKQNAELAEDILANNGALLSEQGFGSQATPRNLVQRDRLQSGLSVGTFVMQTDVKGGSMHTVRYTLMQERALFAPVPQGRHAEEAKSRGILALTQMTGYELCSLLEAQGEYKRLLESTYRDRCVAYPLASREQYTTMLSMLEKNLHVAHQDYCPRRTVEQQGLF